MTPGPPSFAQLRRGSDEGHAYRSRIGMALTGGPGAGTSGVSEPSFVEALVDPTSVFRHPQEVAHHPWFTDQEKRAVLLSWARDELTAEQLASKMAPELELTSCIDAVVEVLAH